MYFLIDKDAATPVAKSQDLKKMEKQGHKELKNWSVVGSPADIVVLLDYTKCKALYENVTGKAVPQEPHAKLSTTIFNELEKYDMAQAAKKKATKKTATKKATKKTATKKATKKAPAKSGEERQGQFGPYYGSPAWDAIPKGTKFKVDKESVFTKELSPKKAYTVDQLVEEAKKLSFPKTRLWNQINRFFLIKQ